MALSLLSICTRALDEISSFNVPTTIIGNTDDTAKTLLAAAYKVGEELVRDYEWQEAGRTATVTTVASTALYDLESDYDRISSDTMWDSTQSRYMSGQTSKREWAAITNAAASSSRFRYRWRLYGGQIQIDPTPDSVFSFNYEYLSNIYCTDSGGTNRANGWMVDTDLPKLPADLFIFGVRYYFGDSKNLPGTSRWSAEYDAIIKSRQNKNVPTGAVNHAASVRRPGRGIKAFPINLPSVIPTA